MTKKTSGIVKNMISVLTNMLKSKVMGVKSKADSIRVRLLVFSLMKSRKFSLASLSSKIQSLLEKESNADMIKEEGEDKSKAIVLYNRCDSNLEYYQYYYYNENDDDNKYPDLTHSLFEEEEDEGVDQSGSVIDLVKNSKENNGEDFSLENEIDQVADLFIRRVKKHMRLEKLESFKRCQAMLGRGA